MTELEKKMLELKEKLNARNKPDAQKVVSEMIGLMIDQHMKDLESGNMGQMVKELQLVKSEIELLRNEEFTDLTDSIKSLLTSLEKYQPKDSMTISNWPPEIQALKSLGSIIETIKSLKIEPHVALSEDIQTKIVGMVNTMEMVATDTTIERDSNGKPRKITSAYPENLTIVTSFEYSSRGDVIRITRSVA